MSPASFSWSSLSPSWWSSNAPPAQSPSQPSHSSPTRNSTQPLASRRRPSQSPTRRQRLSHHHPHQQSRSHLCKQQHIEVIGGGRTDLWTNLAPLPSAASPLDLSKPTAASTAHRPPAAVAAATRLGPPRLPAELTTSIVCLAASSILDEDDPLHSGRGATSRSNRIQRVLALCCVDLACHRSILATLLLPSVRLYGASQVESLRAALERDRHGFRALASARLRKLDVRPHSTRSAHGNEGADDHSASAGSYACAARSPPAKRFALYDAAEAQARFERATLRSLRHILSTCLQIEALSLECMPRALEQLSPRPASSLSVSSAASQAKRLQEERSQQRQLDVLASRVRHLSCHLSVYAGQFNDAFWAPTPSPSTSPSNGRWAALTHLQLYGPRFRFTEATARALASLPSLEQLALIMPLVVQQGNNATGLEGGAGVDDGDDAVSWSDASFDLAGRRNVLQTLVSGARRLRLLLVVGHDNRQYVGWTDRYRPWLRALHRPRPSLRSRSSTSNEEVYGGEAGTAASPSLSLLRIQLLTARERGSGAEEEAATRMTTSRAAHPSLFGRWMMDRTERGRQWSFEPGWSPVKEGDAGHEGDGEGRDVDGDIEFSVEAWDAQQTELVSPDVDRDGDRDGDGFGSTPSPRRTRAAPPPSLVLAAAEQRGEEEVWGIDNLD